MSAFPGVSSYQCSSLGSKFVVIGVVCCQEMRRYALFHKVLRGLAKYLYHKVSSKTENCCAAMTMRASWVSQDFSICSTEFQRVRAILKLWRGVCAQVPCIATPTQVLLFIYKRKYIMV